MLVYPPEHKEIVGALTNGQFILYSHPHYAAVQQQEADYREFFKATFGYDLHVRSEGYIFLSSEESTERDSRNFLIFLAIFCRELGISGQDFQADFELRKFHIDEIEPLLEKSSKSELLAHIMPDNGLDKLLKEWNRRRVIEFTNTGQSQFKFTKAVNLFFEYAMELADTRLKEVGEVEDSEAYH